MNEELIDCPSCDGKGYKDDWDGVRLCGACEGCGFDVDSEQRTVVSIVRRLLQAHAEVKRRAFSKW